MKRVLGLAVGLLLALGVSTPAHAANEFVAGTLNTAYFQGFENLFDSTGAIKAPAIPVIGDHLAGVVNIQHIDTLFSTHFFQGPGNQISGVFAQRVNAVTPLGGGQFLLTFGTPTLSTFCSGADCFSTGLVGTEMFKLYRDTGGITFTQGPTMAGSVASATDGALWLSLTAVGGYAYGIPTDALGQPQGSAYAGLNAVFNGTGYTFTPINDPSEGTFAGLTDLYFKAEFAPNTTPGSPWSTEINDPAAVLPGVIPEPTSMALMGLGLIGTAFRRKKLVA